MKPAFLIAACLLVACDDTTDNANEFISTVQLAFTPATGPAVMAEWDDPDGDGGAPGASQPFALAPGMYTLSVKFLNRLAMPEEDITVEVNDEAVHHMLFFTGTAVHGPASEHPGAPLTQSYADMDANGLPIGLANIVTAAAGSGTLTVTLRHMPPEEPPVKAADTAARVRTCGFDAIGGSTDAQVDFVLTVQ